MKYLSSKLTLGSKEPKNHLSELLPYDLSTKKEKELKIGLEEYKMLLEMLFQSLQAFKQDNLEKFDSVVGENACQIRAVRILSLTKKNVDLSLLENRIKEIQSSIETLLLPKKIAFLMHSKISLKDLIETGNLLISLTSDEMFLIQSFMLTIAKEDNSEEKEFSSLFRKDTGVPKKLKQFGNISSTFAYNLVRNTRKLLSISSVNFIKKLTPTTETNYKMISDEFTIKYGDWLCLPMFWTLKILLNYLQAEKIPIVMHAKFLRSSNENKYTVFDEDFLFFEPSFDSNVPFKNNDSFSSYATANSALIIQGIVVCPNQSQNELFNKNEWKKFINSIPITNIILAGAADHRQYPDSKIDEELINPLKDDEFENFKIFAKKMGFSIENPTAFFIQHVYAQKIEKLIQRQKFCAI